MPLLHVIDFEGSLQSGIVEYGVAAVDGGRVLGLRTRLCAPRAKLRAAETQVHGLRDEDVAGLCPIENEWELFAGLRRTGVLCAHGAGAERSLLRSVWAYPGNVPDWLGGTGQVSDWGPWIDTDRLARAWVARPEGIGTGLAEVVGVLGLQEVLDADAAQWCPSSRRGWHCAGYDALAAAHVLAHLLQLRQVSLRELLLVSAPASARADAEEPRLPGFE